MPIDLTDRPIAIAGASSGIGLATALACAKAGMPVALGARRRDKLEQAADRVRAHGGSPSIHHLDVTDQTSCETFVREANEHHGPIYAAFANAGFGEERAVLDTPLERARDMFETNFFGTLAVLHAAAPTMLDQRQGHLLICSSCLALRPVPHYAMYSATKAAQHHLGQALNVELDGTGVRCSTVHPVGTKTEFFDKAAKRSGGLKLTGGSDRFMQPPARVADAIVRCLKKPRPEVWTDPGARLGLPLSLLLPRTTAAVMKRLVAKRKQRRADAPPHPPE
ncbi:MAG: SDR family NAD(P)-dependent oxidoreductase [Planctomycetota bacterium]